MPSRTSSFAFKGQNVELGVIGKALGVNHVLEGSVRRSGDRIRVTAQLIDVKTDAHIWSETYDRQMADIFDIQDDIAARIVAALRVSLGGQGILPERQRPTENLQAYDLYLQGLELFGQRGDGVGAAVGLLEQAVALDPDFAAAWATLAGVRSVTWDYIRGTDMAEELEASRVAAERALQLDPESSLAIAVLAGLDVLQAVPFLGQRAQRLHEQAQFVYAQRELAGARLEQEADGADDVPDVPVLVGRVVCLAGVVVGDVDLQAPGVVLQHAEAGLAHDPLEHQPPGEAGRHLLLFQLRGLDLAPLLVELRRQFGGGGY